MGKDNRWTLALLSIAGVMLGLTAIAAFRAAYVNEDVPVEMLVYTQSAPDIPDVMENIERLGQETGKGRDLKITVDGADGFAWPWAWYLRDYKYVGYPCLGTEPGCTGLSGPPDADVVLLAARNQDSASQHLTVYNDPILYKHRWWFPESYRGLSPGTVARSLKSRESWCKVAEYFWSRDFGQPIGSTDAYAYFPKGFQPTPIGIDLSKRTPRC